LDVLTRSAAETSGLKTLTIGSNPVSMCSSNRRGHRRLYAL
jgi:hypothetical protein